MAILVKDATGANVSIKTIDDLIDETGEVTPDNPLPARLVASEAQIGRVGGNTPRSTAQFIRPANATVYASGDHIANSTTGSEVGAMEFEVARFPNGSGRITGARCVLEAASGSIVLPRFDLLIFRPGFEIPYRPGSYPADNGTMTISAAAYRELVAVFTFSEAGWRDRAGGTSGAGSVAYQATSLATRQYAPFNLAPFGSNKVMGIVQAQSAWNPGAVAYTFDFALDVDQD